MTLEEARKLALAKHHEASMTLHLLLSEPGMCNHEWPKLIDARKAEASAAKDVCIVNGVIQLADRLREEAQ